MTDDLDYLAEHRRDWSTRLQEFGLPLFGVRGPGLLGPEPGGWSMSFSGNTTGAISVQYNASVPSRRPSPLVSVRTSIESWPADAQHFVRELLGWDLRPPYRFPISSVVGKSEIKLPVNGVVRTAEKYSCGIASVVPLGLEGRWVVIDAFMDPSELEVVSFNELEIDALLSRTQGADF